MASCEMCGVSDQLLKEVRIAGTNMNLCSKCSVHGSQREDRGDISKTFYKKKRQDETQLDVVDDYISKINRALAKKGFNIHHLARAINIKESSLSKNLSSKIKLDITTARKIEDFLEIELVVESKKVKVEDYMDSEEEEEINSNSFGDLLLKKLNEKK